MSSPQLVGSYFPLLSLFGLMSDVSEGLPSILPLVRWIGALPYDLF